MQETTFPLHPAQQDIYTDQLINVQSPLYNIGGYVILKGAVNIEKLHEAVLSGSRVFDAFTLRFDVNQPEPVGYIDQHFSGLDITEKDFTGMDDPRQHAHAWMQERFNTAFVLSKNAVLCEYYLLKVDENEHWLFFKFHHLLSDGFGFVVWWNYVAAKYRSLLAGEELVVSYPSYIEEAVRASAYRHSPAYEAHAAYWKNKISAKPQKLLQRKYVQHTTDSKKSSLYVYNFTQEQQTMLEMLKRTTGVGMQHIFTAALVIYFGKITGNQELVFGVHLHKRASRKLRNIVGMFTGILPHKSEYRQGATVVETLKEIAASQKQDYYHKDYLAGDLTRHLKINASEGYLCDININYELFDFQLDFGEGVQSTLLQLANEYERVPLQFVIQEFGNGQPLQLQLHYWNEYFNQQEIEWFAKRIVHIIEQFPVALDGAIGDVSILPSPEQQLIEGFNNVSVAYPADKSIVDLFEECAAATPEAVALVFVQGTPYGEEEQLS
ncbi:MAG TPA: condensation domain-containing protein, partial [Chitinophagaceae bacterium]|nr:condensation domain-containing protein [Chitinophagaceae bacterium]